MDCDSTGPVIENVVRGGHLRLEGIHFTNAFRSGGSGAVLWFEHLSRVVIDACLFSNSSVSEQGGVVAVSGSDLVIAGSRFEENNAHTGGALAILDGSKAVISNSVFTSCYATVDAGAIYVARSSTLELTGSHLSKNQAQDYGGVLKATDASRVNVSSSIFEDNSNPGWAGGVLAGLWGTHLRLSGVSRLD